MRINIRKLTIAVGIVIFIWLVICYSSILEVQRPIIAKNNIVTIEDKLMKLQKKMDEQIADSNVLLETVKKHLKKTEHTKEVVKHEDDMVMEVIQRHATVLPVLVIACNRVTVKRCLDNLVKFRPNKDTFPIIVSQDCGHEPTYEVIKKFTEVDPSITVVKQPDLSEIKIPRAKVKFRGYYKVARHFKFALNYVFETLKHEAVIIVEDDLDVSPDFFEYFLGTYPLLQKDPTLWCISAWNDNGKKDVIDMSRPELLHRTDFFPGLGWLLRRETWTKLAPKWPPAFFDDWLRNPENIDGKACIRPEISRTYSFGKIGVSKGLFFDVHLRNIKLNLDYVEFTKLNLTYLLKVIKKECLNLWREYFDKRSLEKGIWYKTIQAHLPNDTWINHNELNRVDTVTALRLRPGHIPSNKFGYLMKKINSPNCSECGVVEDVQHILMECVRNEDARRRLFGREVSDIGLCNSVLAFPFSGQAKALYKMVQLALENRENYDNVLISTVDSLPEMTVEEVLSGRGDQSAVKVVYSNAKSFQKAAKALGLMDDFRSGVPRTAYRGVVSCYIHGRRVYLVPSFEWTQYDPTWG